MGIVTSVLSPYIQYNIPLITSINGATIPSLSQLVDGSLNVWTVVGGVVYENGTATVSGSVILLLYFNGVIYQENINDDWWYWNGSTWIATVDPRLVTNLTATGVSNTEIDLSWTPIANVINYNVYRNTTLIFSGASGNTTNNYHDTGLSNATSYSYNVAITTASGLAPQCNAVVGTTLGGSTDVFGVKNINGNIYSTLTNNQVFLVGSAMISSEESEAWGSGTGGRVAAIANVTSGAWLNCSTYWANTVAAIAKPYTTINMIRVPLNSALWLNLNGIDPFQGTSANCNSNYTMTGTDGNGRFLYQADPNHLYQTLIIKEVQAILNAGLYVLLDLHWGTPTLASTGQYVLPTGQPCMPGPVDVTFWSSIANTFGTQNTTTGNAGIIFELFNEPFGTDNFLGNAGYYQQRPFDNAFLSYSTEYLFPNTSGPEGVNGGYRMLRNNTDNASTPILNGGATCYATGYQAMINAIVATGANNLVVAGSMNYSGSPDEWLSLGLTDSRHQLAMAYHGYGFNLGNTYFKQVASNGFPVICTELGELTSIPMSYVDWRANGWGYSFWSWSNYNPGSNVFTNALIAYSPWSQNNQQVAPNGTN